MDLIEALQSVEKIERPPQKRGASSYLTEQQHLRLNLLAERSRRTRSVVIGKLIDMAYERLTKVGAE